MTWLSFPFENAQQALLIYILITWLLWVIVMLPPKIVRVSSLYMGARGLALPGFLFILHEEPESTIHHELTHALQMRRYSPLGVGLYLGWHYGKGFVQQKLAGQPLDFWALWRKNPLEIEACEKMQAGVSPLHYPWSSIVGLLCHSLLLALCVFYMYG